MSGTAANGIDNKENILDVSDEEKQL